MMLQNTVKAADALKAMSARFFTPSFCLILNPLTARSLFVIPADWSQFPAESL